MTEMYWITRFDGISGFLCLIAVLSVVTTIVVFFIGLLSKSDANIHPEGSAPWKLHMDIYNKYLYWSKRCAIVFFVSVFMNLFIPTTNEALLIYGVGGTIDYIKSNDTAKQLPVKCIKALDKWAENLNEEKKQDKKEE